MSEMEDIDDSSMDMEDEVPVVSNIQKYTSAQQQFNQVEQPKQEFREQIAQEEIIEYQQEIPPQEFNKQRQVKSKSPERNSKQQDTGDRKRQSSQPAVPVSQEVIDQLLQEQRAKMIKDPQQGIKATERLLKYQEDLKSKKKEKGQAIVQEQMKECTFKPQILTKPNTQSRNFNEFIDSQMKYDRMKREKIQIKKEELLEKQIQQEDELMQSKNYLCQGSARILSKVGETKPVHERLYQVKQKTNLKKQLSGQSIDEFESIQTPSLQEEQAQQFMPKINPKSKNLIRQGKIEDLLYADSRRREEKQKSKQETKTQEVKTSQNSKKVLRKKLISEYKEYLQQIGSPTRISYANLSRLLQQLHFIKNEMNDSAYQKERELQRQLWNLLQGDEKGGISDKNLLKFILAFNNLWEEKVFQQQESVYMVNIVDQADQQKLMQHDEQFENEQDQQIHQQSKQEELSENSDNQASENLEKQTKERKIYPQISSQDNQSQVQNLKENAENQYEELSVIENQKYGIYQEDNFIITEQQAFRIFSDFRLFYSNRHALMKNNMNPTIKNIQNFEFKPQVDKNSQKMAQQLRDRKGDADIVQHLLNQGKEQENKLKQKMEILEEQKNQTYTFKPNCQKPLKLKEAVQIERKAESQDPRFKRLFYMHKDIIKKAEEKQKTKKEIENQLDEACTFKPKLETGGY